MATSTQPGTERWTLMLGSLAATVGSLLGMIQAEAGSPLIATRILTIVEPTVITLWLGGTSGYLDSEVRQALWRAGHAHAGVLLILALVALRYVDETSLRGRWLWLARHGTPNAAILMPAGFFLSVVDPAATAPNVLIGLVYVGGVFLVGGLSPSASGSCALLRKLANRLTPDHETASANLGKAATVVAAGSPGSGGHDREAECAGRLRLAQVERQEADPGRGDPLCGREMEGIERSHTRRFRDRGRRFTGRFVELDDGEGAQIVNERGSRGHEVASREQASEIAANLHDRVSGRQ